MKKILMYILLFFVFTINVGAANKVEIKNLGIFDSDIITDVIKTDDDGFIILYTDKNSKSIIKKYDKYYKVEWSKEIVGKYNSVIQDEEKNYILVGNSDGEKIDGLHMHGSSDAIISKYDNNGNFLWVRSFGGKKNDTYNKIIDSYDGYVVVGTSFSNDISRLKQHGLGDGFIVKYDKNGSIEWANLFGGSEYDEFLSVVKIEDYYYAVGSSGSHDIVDMNMKHNNEGIIIKYDKEGNVVSKFNDGDFYKIDYILKNDNDGTYILAGSSNEKNSNFIKKYDFFDKVVRDGVENIFSDIMFYDDTVVIIDNEEDPYFSGYVKYDKNLILTVSSALCYKEYIYLKILNFDTHYLVFGLDVSTNEIVILNVEPELYFYITPVTNGTVKVNQRGNGGIITAIPDEGYIVDSVKASFSDKVFDVVKIDDTTYSFVSSSDSVVTVKFKKDDNYEKNSVVEIIIWFVVILLCFIGGFIFGKKIIKSKIK